MGSARMDNSNLRMMASVNIFAMLYLAGDGNGRVRPYVEAGIGGIYTDYRVSGQDYRFNFNPQAGVGMELDMGGAHPCFTSVRVHHLSNGGIGASNRGQNSVVCLFGRYF
ncbi:MAG: acyloxyacyl hydrolase [Desulfotignum sp.]|nr:acyloxyacyl hydrolase [Desulfotignum sp.]